jgi:SulP family sulfate permease
MITQQPKAKPMNTKQISNILAGMLIGVMNITVAVSVAALMFAGTNPSFLAPGIVVLLIGTVVVGLGGTFLSDYPGVICAPRSGLAPVFAAIFVGIHANMSGQPPDEVLPTMLVAIMVSSVVTGLFLMLLGQLKLGHLVRYIPYPVMGGFFAGIGYMFIRGGLTVAMSDAPSVATLADSHLLMLAVPSVIFAICLYVMLAKFDHWATFPLLLIAAFIIFYAVFFNMDLDFDAVTTQGWLPAIQDAPGILFPVVPLDKIPLIDWWAIFGQSGGIIVVALLSAMMLLLDTSGIEIITKRDLDPDKELKSIGGANIASGLLGGYPGVHVASDTAFTYKLGGDSRLMGLVYAGVVVLTILAGTEFIGKVPTFVLGGLLVYVGLDFLIDWVWKTWKELPLADYLIVLSILVVIATVDILEGVAFGFAVSVVLFVINYSRLSIIKNETTGRERGGNVDRDLATRELLNAEGEKILILTLQGFIFFGTSDKLLSEIRRRIEEQTDPKLEFLVLDFYWVSQLDTSAIKAFTKLAQLSDRFGFNVVITGTNEIDNQHLEDINFFVDRKLGRLRFEFLDDGVTWCENQILESKLVTDKNPDRALADFLLSVTKDQDAARSISDSLVEEQRKNGEFLFRQGEKGECLYIVTHGSVAVVIDQGTREHVLRRYNAGSILGEMALYTGAPRSASVRLQEDSVLYRLDVDKMEQLQEAHPAAAGKLHSYIVRVLSERLSRADRELQRYF